MFQLMFRAERLDHNRPALHEAREKAFTKLAAIVSARRHEDISTDHLTLAQAADIAHLVHGARLRHVASGWKVASRSECFAARDDRRDAAGGDAQIGLASRVVMRTPSRIRALKWHGEKSASTLEAAQSAQASRQGVKAPDAGQKAAAKARARRAGRRYPNLVDNMRMASASKSSGKKSAKKASKKRVGRKRAAHKSAVQKTVANAPAPRGRKTRHGGLTAVGRKAFAKKEGAHLKPGVKKKASEMTPSDMRRKGSWAVRFYGRKQLPPLQDANGKPTRHALSAHAWGERVPKTVAAARKIAAKGERLLARYRRIKKSPHAQSSKR